MQQAVQPGRLLGACTNIPASGDGYGSRSGEAQVTNKVRIERDLFEWHHQHPAQQRLVLEELLAHNLTVDEIRDYLNVDSLAFITLDRLIASTGTSGAGFCDACFTGNYPVDVPVSLTKGVLEGGVPPATGGDPSPESTVIVGGDLFTAGRHMQAGDFLHADAGTDHADLWSPNGCVALIMEPVEGPEIVATTTP